MNRQVVLFCILSLSLSLKAQDKESIVKQIIKTNKSYNTYEVDYIYRIKYQSQEDTIIDTVHNRIVKSGKDIVARNTSIKGNHKWNTRTAYNGLEMVNLYNDEKYSQLAQNKNSDAKNIENSNQQTDYKPFNKTKKDLKSYNVLQTDSHYVLMGYQDTSKDKMIATDIVSKCQILVNTKTGLIEKTEDWYWFEGGLQYSKMELVSIRKLDKTYPDKIRKQASIDILKYKTFLNNDSINKAFMNQFVLLKEGDTMPAFGGRKFGSDDSISFSADNNNILIFDFFYTTCGPCVAAIPSLQKIDSVYRSKGVLVYGIDPFVNDRKKLPKFTEMLHINYGIIQTDRAVSMAFGVTGYPTLMVIKNGIVRYVHVGYSDKLFSVISEVLDEIVK